MSVKRHARHIGLPIGEQENNSCDCEVKVQKNVLAGTLVYRHGPKYGELAHGSGTGAWWAIRAQFIEALFTLVLRFSAAESYADVSGPDTRVRVVSLRLALRPLMRYRVPPKW